MEYPLLQLEVYPFGKLLKLQPETSASVKTILVNSDISVTTIEINKL